VGHEIKYLETLKGVRQPPNPFRVGADVGLLTQGSRSSNPGLKLANACGVFFKLNQYPHSPVHLILTNSYLLQCLTVLLSA